MIHKIKLRKEYADAVLFGDKTFEVRYNDRGYQKGDGIRFTVVDDYGTVYHPLNDANFTITYVLSGWGLKEDYVALSIRRDNETRKEQTYD